MKRKLIVIAGIFAILMSLHFTALNEDSHATINIGLLGPLSYHISPDAGGWNELTFINLTLQGTYQISPLIALGVQSGYWQDLTHDDLDPFTTIPLHFLCDIDAKFLLVQVGGGFYMQEWGSYEETDIGFFGGIYYPIKVGNITIPIGTQMHMVFWENDTNVKLKFGAGVRLSI